MCADVCQNIAYCTSIHLWMHNQQRGYREKAEGWNIWQTIAAPFHTNNHIKAHEQWESKDRQNILEKITTWEKVSLRNKWRDGTKRQAERGDKQSILITSAWTAASTQSDDLSQRIRSADWIWILTMEQLHLERSLWQNCWNIVSVYWLSRTVTFVFHQAFLTIPVSVSSGVRLIHGANKRPVSVLRLRYEAVWRILYIISAAWTWIQLSDLI